MRKITAIISFVLFSIIGTSAHARDGQKKSTALATCKAKSIVLYKDLEVIESEDGPGGVYSNFQGKIETFKTQMAVKSVDDFQYEPYHGPIAGIKVTTTNGLQGWIDPYQANCCQLDPMKCKTE